MSSVDVPKGQPLQKLLDYLAGLADEEAREAFALACGCSLGHMRNCAYGYKGKFLPEKTCVQVEMRTRISRRDLRPTDWFDIWPELAQQSATPASGEHASARSHPGRRSTDEHPNNCSERRNA